MSSAIIYIRFSTPEQERGDSRRRQLDDCRKWCVDNGLDVIEIVEDLGRSAYKGDHLNGGNLGKLTQRIMRGEYESGTTIVVEKMDRLSRERPRIIRRWIEDVCDRGLRIARLKGPVIDSAYIDGDNMMAVMELAWEHHASHAYSQSISDRLGETWAEKRRRTVRGEGLLTATAPKWLRTVGEWRGKGSPDYRRFEVIPERGAIVVRIYQMAAEGIGTWGIARKLNELNVATWGKASESSTRAGWNHTSVLNILKSPAAEGIHHPTVELGRKRVPSGDVLRDYYPLIEGLDADLIARARSQLAKRAGGGPRSNQGRNLLASLATCGECGGAMVLRTRSIKEGPYCYLQCDNAAKAKGCSSVGMLNYRYLEPAILDAVLHLALDDAFFAVADRAAELRIEVAELERAMAVTLADRDSARALYIKHADEPEFEQDWRRLSDEYRKQEEARVGLRANLAEARGEISGAEHLRRVHNFRAALDDEDPDVKRTARLRVRDALRAVVSSAKCFQARDGAKVDKWMDLAIANGLLGFRFDERGEVLNSWDFRNSPDHVRGLTAGGMTENAPLVDDVLRRSS